MLTKSSYLGIKNLAIHPAFFVPVKYFIGKFAILNLCEWFILGNNWEIISKFRVCSEALSYASTCKVNLQFCNWRQI